MNKDWQKLQSGTIDCLRPIFALMVVGLHVRQYYTDGTETFFDGLYEASTISIFRVLFSVAVPAFFLISGYLFFKKLEDWNTNVWLSKVKKRGVTLLIPYLLWNLIAICGFFITRTAGCLIKGNESVNIISVLNERGWFRLFWDRCLYGGVRPDQINLFGVSVGQGTPMDEPAWFLRDLMVVVLMSPIIFFMIKKAGKLFLVLVGLLYCVDLWIPYAGFSSKAFFMFSVGAWFCINRLNMLEFFCKNSKMQLFLSILLLIIASVSFNGNEWIYCISSKLFVLSAIPMFFNIGAWLVEKQNLNGYSVFTAMSKSSFFVYMIHTILVVDAVNWLLTWLLRPNNDAVNFILMVSGTILVYIICHCIYLIMNIFMPKVLAVLTGGRVVVDKKTSEK
ncbi:MAG: acyltransferase [Salinivirgaceae bacterium]|nr:acyltransferase [Salinivirgaceae bacterium]